jgi:ABC-type dipeptide/oligopeptide/nickel transport system permease subunit
VVVSGYGGGDGGGSRDRGTRIRDAWRLSAVPGPVIVLAACGVNLLGDGLRDRLDPRDRSR